MYGVEQVYAKDEIVARVARLDISKILEIANIFLLITIHKITNNRRSISHLIHPIHLNHQSPNLSLDPPITFA